MAIRWMRNVIIEGEKSTLEVQLGDKKMGDKCYTRISNEVEQWFANMYETRDDVIAQGLDILKKKLETKKVTYPDGTAYDWK
jgi:hypothetical protein